MTSEDTAILDTIERWLARDVRPHVMRLDHADEYPHEMVGQMRDLGLFGATIPVEYGGLGLSAATYAKIVEKIAETWMSLSGIFNSHLIMAACVTRAGTPEQATEHAEFMVLARSDTPDLRMKLLSLAELSLITTSPGGLKDFDGFPPSANGPDGLGLIVSPRDDLPLGAKRPLAYRLFIPVTAAEYATYRTLELEARVAWCVEHLPTLTSIADRWP